MPKQSFTFSNFSNGFSIDPSKWKTHGYYAAGLDVVGLKDIAGYYTGGQTGVLQLAQNLVKDTVSAGSSSGEWHVKGLVEWIRRWDGVSAGDLYAFAPILSAGSGGVILKNSQGTGTWVSAQQSRASIGGGGLERLSANMYYGQDDYLGQITSASVYNNTFGAFTKAGQTPRPMKIFAGVLNVGNDRYISTVDSSGTFTAAALTLPAEFTVRSLEVLGDYLVISADNGIYSRIFLWTGGNATYQEAYDLPEFNAPNLVSKEGRVYAIGQQIYQLNEVNFTILYPYSYTGAGFTTSITGNNFAPQLGEVAVWHNRILYGLDQSNQQGLGLDEVGGVWMLQPADPTYPLAYSSAPVQNLYFLLPTSALATALSGAYHPFNVNTGGIYADQTNLIKIGYEDTQATAASARYQIATLDTIYTPITSNYAYYLTLPINCDTEVNKIFHSIRLTLLGKSASSSVTVAYRTNVDWANNYGSSRQEWTTLKTLALNDTANSLAVPIRQMARNIQFRFQFVGDGTTSPRMVDYTLIYETLDQYR